MLVAKLIVSPLIYASMLSRGINSSPPLATAGQQSLSLTVRLVGLEWVDLRFESHLA